jgi:50S ribosomal subunit-associated GTPase HflX
MNCWNMGLTKAHHIKKKIKKFKNLKKFKKKRKKKKKKKKKRPHKTLRIGFSNSIPSSMGNANLKYIIFTYYST